MDEKTKRREEFLEGCIVLAIVLPVMIGFAMLPGEWAAFIAIFIGLPLLAMKVLAGILADIGDILRGGR